MLADLSAEYWWMLLAGLFVFVDLRFPGTGAWTGGLGAAVTSFLVMFTLSFSLGYQVVVFVFTTLLFLTARFIWKGIQGRSDSAHSQGYATILTICPDGSILAEFERTEWPAVLVSGKPVEGMIVRVTAISNGMLWCDGSAVVSQAKKNDPLVS